MIEALRAARFWAIILAGIFVAGFIGLLLAATLANAAPVAQFCGDRVCSFQGQQASAPHVASLGSTRPAGCPRQWCGCWARMQIGSSDTRLNNSLMWPRLFRHVPQQIGAWAVMHRKGGGHVGRVVGVDPNGNPVIESGNHGHRVGVGTYAKGRIIAYVMP